MPDSVEWFLTLVEGAPLVRPADEPQRAGALVQLKEAVLVRDPKALPRAYRALDRLFSEDICQTLDRAVRDLDGRELVLKPAPLVRRLDRRSSYALALQDMGL